MRLSLLKCNAVASCGAFLLALTGSPQTHAATWSSIRANNRSPEAAPHAQAGAMRGNEGRGVQRAPAEAPREAVPNRGREAEVARGRGEERARVGGGERTIEPHNRVEWAGREHGHWDFEANSRHAYYWSRYSPGMVVGVLPPGYQPLYVGGTPYYYYDGTYYEAAPSGYVVATPPIGAMVPDLPPGAEAIAVGPTVYYYAGGAFYVQTPSGFQVVAPPLGVTVSYLPPGATSAVINGAVYYQANGIYYLPVMQGGVTAYMTAQP